jgi:hypothetical protein
MCVVPALFRESYGFLKPQNRSIGVILFVGSNQLSFLVSGYFVTDKTFSKKSFCVVSLAMTCSYF